MASAKDTENVSMKASAKALMNNSESVMLLSVRSER